ncbi:FAD-dependent oxidoreductase [Brevundimonas lenta]|uniref:NADPH-dependent 2,4-dienoyl-CoA reductase/sulfur reductase-like enzyme/nitrite reductase/ring-hydroxylating ferredoxin subunit n=1 Tax=Brevundimonas lenta TaxID=424796 RepID=A0A7W6JFB9_9CAUL|nr:FAD-dependent oxidoreductase [Brevundimonas lenta]MBB4083082.1 NADPH-dependent 2,4-dienoyl-CoA reductase/sulfur reductase-like enzyme/nitrite reductase/ring-hydroxylating ferredoxin subunit [Brevundimonas lenta]
MGATQGEPKGPDFSNGVPLADVPDQGALPGHVAGEPVLLLRRHDGLFAVNATCTHYGGPLGEGLVTGDTVHCPWHHACFDLRTGEAVGAPAIDRLQRWTVEIEGDRAFVRTPAPAAPPQPSPTAGHPDRVVIVGGGAAGFAAAEMLRRRGYAGALTMLSADSAPPCDRPNLSKDYLAGTAPEDWIPLRSPKFYEKRQIDLRLEVEVATIDLKAREVVTSDGERIAWDALLLATGAEPIRLAGAGFDRPEVHVLRTLADARRLIAALPGVNTAAVVGSSFIGLEAAASLRERGLDVAVIGPDALPLAKVMGPEIGAFVKALHETKGVRFLLGQAAEAFDGEAVILADGSRVPAELVVLGVGVRARLQLAIDAGLEVDRGVVVDTAMRTSAPGVWAAGDIARYPEPVSAAPARIEHWVVAERQGQIAALSILGEDAAMTDTPFFWSRHYDTTINYVGHAEGWDAIRLDGSLADADATVRFERGGRLLAAATIGRDLESLEIADAMGN